MNLYLDTEFNGHGGELLSLAIAAPNGSAWYGVMPRKPDAWTHSWVAEHVVPKLHLSPANETFTEDDFRDGLRDYLESQNYEEGPLTIYADWPDDFAHLMRVMSGPSYEQSWMFALTMELIITPPGEPKPDIPHNALSDAKALMQWHMKTKG